MATKPPSAAEVTDAYISILGRPPDPGGLAHFTSAAGAQTTSGLTGIDAVIKHLEYAIATGQENKAANQAAVAAATPAATAAVTQAYEQTLGRAPDPAGLNFYVNQVIGGQADPTRVAAVLADSPEARAKTGAGTGGAGTGGAGTGGAKKVDPLAARRTGLTDLYKSVFGRDPDPGGLDFYLTGGGKDLDLTRIGDIFRDSPEFKVKNPAKDDEGNIIAPELRDQIVNLYQRNLGRTPSDSEIEGWISTFQKGTTKFGTADPVSFISNGLITPAGREAFMIGANQELARKSREAFVEKIPRFDLSQSGLFPTQFTFPTEQRPQEILGITGRQTTPRGIADLYQRFLGRAPDPEGLQFYTQKFGPTMTPQGVSDFIGDIYRPGGELAVRGGVLPELAYRGLVAPPQAPTLSYGSQEVSPFGVIAPAGSVPATSSGRAGGLVGYKEGGMPKLSAKEAGSQFDVSQFIDEQGRLVGGYNRPIYDENNVLVGYDFQPYQRDVVFNPELREAERIERERMSRMAKGGLASIAENLAEKGRGGDTMLVHMAPEEVAGLRGLAMQMGGDLSINPQTGLPEAKWLKRLLPLLPFVLGPLGYLGTGFLSTLAGKSLLSGVIGGFTAPGKGFNFKEGLKTGITAYAGGKLFEALGSLGQTPGPAPGTAPGTAPSTGTLPVDAGGVSSGAVDPGLAQAVEAAKVAQAVPNPALTPAPAVGQAQITNVTDVPIAGVGANAPAPTLGSGLQSLAGGAVEATTGAIARNPMTAASLAVSGYGMVEGEKERQAFKAAEAAAARDEEEERRRYQNLFAQTLGRIPMGAGGGMVAFADGGMPTFEYGGTTAPTGEPRMVKGAGDGMSDNVPANIEGVQEARLANDEFVVPADVVADIGNGSSSAGAKKLYAMMDRIRKARHGTTEQPPEIEAERLMPA
jgi:hypothetical protein